MKRVTLLLSIMITAVTAFAQQAGLDAKTEADPFGWKVNWVPFYLWMSGIDGNIGVGGKTAPVGAGFSDSFANVNIGYTTALDVRYDRVGLLTDLAYIDLGSDNTLSPGVLYTQAHSDAKQFFIDPELYARLFESDRGSVDALAGFRYWHLTARLRLDPGILPAFSGDETHNFVDPVLGARFRVNLKRGFFATLKGDAGGFGVGSQLSWQIYTGLGKEFKKRYSLFLGYRRLDIDYRSEGVIFDTKMNGALLGFGVRLK